jgi:hypothetical protein
MINNKIGNITRVKWHYVNYKYALNSWGYMRETFDANMYIVEEMIEIKDEQGNITNTYPVRNFDESMLKDKKYAYVYIEEDSYEICLIVVIVKDLNRKIHFLKMTFLVDFY